MPITYDIVFDNDEKVYYNGQTLKGRVKLTVRGPEPVVLEGKNEIALLYEYLRKKDRKNVLKQSNYSNPF